MRQERLPQVQGVQEVQGCLGSFRTGPLEVGRGHIVEVMLKSRGAVPALLVDGRRRKCRPPRRPLPPPLRVVGCVLVLPTWHGRLSSVCGRSAFLRCRGSRSAWAHSVRPLEVGRGHIVEVMLKSRGAVSCAPRRWAAAQMQAPAPPIAAALRVVGCVLVLPTWHGRFSSVCGRSAFLRCRGSRRCRGAWAHSVRAS